MRKPSWVELLSLVIAFLSLAVAVWATWPTSAREAELRFYTSGLGLKIVNDQTAESFRLMLANNGAGPLTITSAAFECDLGGGDAFTTCGLNYPWLLRNLSIVGRRLEPGKAATALHVDPLGLKQDSKPSESFEQFSQNIQHVSLSVNYRDDNGATHLAKWHPARDGAGIPR